MLIITTFIQHKFYSTRINKYTVGTKKRAQRYLGYMINMLNQHDNKQFKNVNGKESHSQEQ